MKPIARSREQHYDLATIFVVAILVGLGVSLLASSLSAFSGESPKALLAISILLLLAGATLLWARFLLLDDQVVHAKGALAFEKDDDRLVEKAIFGYEFNHAVCGFLSGFLSENQAFKKHFWNENSPAIRDREIFDPDELSFHSIVISAVEFWYLHELDLHLNSYFVDNKIDTSTIVEVSREQMGADILKNRVLELFTRRMQERAAFSDHKIDESEGIIVSSTGKDGAIYERLDMELPPNSKISRNCAGHLVISNPYFSLEMSCDFSGCATYVPWELFKKRRNLKDSAPYNVRISLVATTNPFKFLSPRVAQQYQWLDSFIARVVEKVSTDGLAARLNPDIKEFFRAES